MLESMEPSLETVHLCLERSEGLEIEQLEVMQLWVRGEKLAWLEEVW